MIRKARAFRPLASPLESRLLLSLAAAPWLGRGAPAQRGPAFAPKNQPVNTLTGGYLGVGNLHVMDFPLSARIDGMGWVKGMGHARVSGSLDIGGYGPIHENWATLSNLRGTITVRLGDPAVSTTVPGASFNVTAIAESGTGTYKDVRRIGTATLSFGPDTIHDETMSFTNAIGGALAIELNLKSTSLPTTAGRSPEPSTTPLFPWRLLQAM